jgi:chromosome segregation ATPase
VHSFYAYFIRNDKLHQSNQNEALADIEKKSVSKEMGRTEKRNQLLHKEISKLRSDLDEGIKNIDQMRQINNSMSSDLVIHKRVQNKYRKEKEVLERKIKEFENEFSLMKKKYEQVWS